MKSDRRCRRGGGGRRPVARLAPRVAVTAYAPMAENMPSGSAQRPSDVLTMYGGRTVEVLNTDAEGRLILADAIVRAGEDGPDLIVDIATHRGMRRRPRHPGLGHHGHRRRPAGAGPRRLGPRR